jgi:hypothetical protein
MAATAKKVITGKVRASYVSVFAPKMNNLSGEEEYSMQLIIDKKDTATVKKIRDAITEAANDKWSGKPPRNIRDPLRDADKEAEEKDEPIQSHLKGCYFMNVKSKQPVGIVDRQKHKVEDPTAFQSGDYCRVSLNAYAYDMKGNRGVSFGLNNVQVLEKGDPLGNRSRPEDDFDIEDDDDDDDEWAD